MDQIAYIPMDEDMKLSLAAQYRKPFRNNVTLLTVVFIGLYAIIFLSANGLLQDSAAPGSKSGGAKSILFNIGLVAVMFLVYANVYGRFRKMNVHFLKDAESGKIVKERTRVIRIFDTPSGVNIYWLDSATIRSFTPEPYRHFREGDEVTIYYLEYSARYLAYELP